METWTVAKLLNWTTEYFQKANIEAARLEAELLLAFSLGIKRLALYTDHHRQLTTDELAKFKGLVQRRALKEPLAYITNHQPFMSLDFYVDRSVLIPRPETELLVELVIEEIKRTTNHEARTTIADIGTGSGCIAVSLAKYLPQIRAIGVDDSDQAIVIAHKNAVLIGVAERCEFRVGDLLEPLLEPVNLIVSNPPYIPSRQIDGLQAEVKVWEPRSALDGGRDGLRYLERIIRQAPEKLVQGGSLFLEIGFDQKQGAREIAEQTGRYAEVRVIKDLNRKDRILAARLQ